MRRWLISIACCLALALAGTASAGVDQGYSKTEGKQSWGDIFRWAVGGSGLGKSFALIVGVNNYTGGFDKLEATANDPDRMRQFLLQEAGYDYVHMLTNENVTTSRLRSLILDDFRDRVGAEDRFLFYWSGHGIPVPDYTDEQLGYLPLTASRPNSLASMVSMQEILSWTKLVKAKQVLHLLDTCFSGLANLPESKGGLADHTIEQLAKSSRHLMTATTGPQQTIAARRWSGSVFTDAFIHGARGEADAERGQYGKDGVVELSELLSYIRQRVNDERRLIEWPSEITPKRFDLRSNEGEFFFIANDKKLEVASKKGQATGKLEDGMPVVVMGHDAGDQAEPSPMSAAVRPHVEVWQGISGSNNPDDFEFFIGAYPGSPLVSLAKRRLEELRRQKTAALTDETQPTSLPELPRSRIDPEAAEEAALELTFRDRTEIQTALKTLGHDPGVVDGRFGSNTRTAIASWQNGRGDDSTGYLTKAQHDTLLRAAERRMAQAPTIRPQPNAPSLIEPAVGTAPTVAPPGVGGSAADSAEPTEETQIEAPIEGQGQLAQAPAAVEEERQPVASDDDSPPVRSDPPPEEAPQQLAQLTPARRPLSATSQAQEVEANSVMNQQIVRTRLETQLIDDGFVNVEVSAGRRTAKADYPDVQRKTDWVTCSTEAPVSMAIDAAWKKWLGRARGGTIVTLQASLHRDGEAATDCALAGTFLEDLATRSRLTPRTTIVR